MATVCTSFCVNFDSRPTFILNVTIILDDGKTSYITESLSGMMGKYEKANIRASQESLISTQSGGAQETVGQMSSVATEVQLLSKRSNNSK